MGFRGIVGRSGMRYIGRRGMNGGTSHSWKFLLITDALRRETTAGFSIIGKDTKF
jgi:hypothetical protein